MTWLEIRRAQKEQAYQDAFQTFAAALSALAEVVGFEAASAFLQDFVREWTSKNQGGRPLGSARTKDQLNSDRRTKYAAKQKREAEERMEKIAQATRHLIAQARAAGVPEERIRLWTDHPADRPDRKR